MLINNDNDVIIEEVFFVAAPDDRIEDASFQMTLCEEAKIFVTSYSGGTVITNKSHGLSPGDRVLINRCVADPSANGKFTVLTVPENDEFTIDVNINDYVEAGQVWKILDEDVEIVWNDVIEAYVGTLQASLQLVEKRKYMLFIEEVGLQIQIEFPDTGVVRTRN